MTILRNEGAPEGNYYQLNPSSHCPTRCLFFTQSLHFWQVFLPSRGVRWIRDPTIPGESESSWLVSILACLWQMHEHLPPGIAIVTAENFEEWQMDIKVLDDNPLYKGETYRLKFTFSSKYPIGQCSFSGGDYNQLHLNYSLIMSWLQNRQKSNS